MALSADGQRLIDIDGRFKIVGQWDFSVDDITFSFSIYSEGEIQMVDGEYWERLDTFILLPTSDKLNKFGAATLKSALNKKYPTYETGHYTVEDDYLTFLSDRRSIETACTTWDQWEKICEEQNNPSCGMRMDNTLFAETKETFLEKQKILKAALNN